MKTRMVVAIGVALGVAVLSPLQASAQAWIGQVAAEAVIRETRAQEERACRAGEAASSRASQAARTNADRLLNDYFRLTSASPPRDIQQVFATRADARWTDQTGVVPVLDLGPRLDAPTPEIRPAIFVVGGDGQSARGVWIATLRGQTVGYYAVNFVYAPSALIGGTWGIAHMSVYPPTLRPASPEAYCHYDTAQVWHLGEIAPAR